MSAFGRTLIAAITIFGLFGCGESRPSAPAVAKVIRSRVPAAGKAATIAAERLIEPRAVAKFYEARAAKAAWTDPSDAEQVVAAIKGMEQDGLTPTDYHLTAIESLRQEREKASTPELEGDLDVLLTDAVAAMLDHVQYGRVRPLSLDSTWNVDPRKGAPPLEDDVARVAAANSITDAMNVAKPSHFIYRGLVGELARLREIDAKGGWPQVPPGRNIAAGARDRRIPAIRARLAASGELTEGSPSDSLVYDKELQAAVELFQARHRIETSAVIGKSTIAAMDMTARDRAEQVRINLERSRWVLGGLQDDFVLLNLPAYKAYVIRGGKNIWEARTQIGEEAKQTPTFRADMKTVVFNPDWTVPQSIIADEIVTGMRKDKNYLTKKKLLLLDKDNQEVKPSSVDWGSDTADHFAYTVRQPPGEGNALGRVKFLFPNDHSIYLHDTPSKQQFEADRRMFSHGCIRVENPRELARVLLEGQEGWDAAKIDETIATGETKNVTLEHPLPVLIVYWTVSVGVSGEIRYMNDIYDLDAPVLAALGATPQIR